MPIQELRLLSKHYGGFRVRRISSALRSITSTHPSTSEMLHVSRLSNVYQVAIWVPCPSIITSVLCVKVETGGGRNCNNIWILNFLVHLVAQFSLVHDITPCDDLPNFEGVLSSCVTETPFANRESIIVEEVCTGTTPETVTIAPVQAEDDASNPAKEFNQKPPERKRRKLPEIPKIHQHQSMSRVKRYLESCH